jgi:dUTP pyrophosphatase
MTIVQPASTADTLTVHITRIHPEARLPQYESEDAAAFDLAAVADVTVEPGRVALVPTGLVVQVPVRMFLGIFARSSTPVKRGLMVANGVGVIDPDYCGPDDEVKIAVMNFSNTAVTVRSGDRIAQGIFLEAPRVQWVEGKPRETSRGGFGATGA